MNPTTLALLQTQPGSAELLFTELIKRHRIKNFDRLANALGVTPPVISKMRSGRLIVGPTIILYIHEAFDMPVAEIKALAGLTQPVKPEAEPHE